MRILALPIITPDSPQAGLRTALSEMGSEYLEFDWHAYYRRNQVRMMRRELVKAAEKFQPDFTFLQIQTPGVLTPAEYSAIPGFKLSWCGDCRQPTPRHYLDEAKHVNVTCFSNEDDVEVLRKAGHRAEFLKEGFSDDVFHPPGGYAEFVDIVFMGNNYGERFPQSNERVEMVELLRQTYGDDFGCYGFGWPFETRWLNEPTERVYYSACKIAINQNHFNDVTRFSSDRLLRAMGSGAFVLSNYFPGIEKDFSIGEHLDVWHDFAELTEKIDYYRMHDSKRRKIARQGCKHVHQNHTWRNRTAQMRRFLGADV